MLKIPKKRKERAFNRTFGGKKGFIRYAYRKRKKDAIAYKNRLKEQPKKRYVRVIKTPKSSSKYKQGFRYEVWSRHK